MCLIESIWQNKRKKIYETLLNEFNIKIKKSVRELERTKIKINKHMSRLFNQTFLNEDMLPNMIIF